VDDPPESRVGLGRKAAEILQPGTQLELVGAGKASQRIEGALDDIGRVERLVGQLLALPPEGAFAFLDVLEADLAQPARQPRSGIAPA